MSQSQKEPENIEELRERAQKIKTVPCEAYPNLRQIVSDPEASRAAGKLGGIASGAARRKKRAMKDLANDLLATVLPESEITEKLEALGLSTDVASAILLAQALKAIDTADTTAAVFVRDTAGQKPRDSIEVLTPEAMTDDDIGKLSDGELLQLIEE